MPQQGTIKYASSTEVYPGRTVKGKVLEKMGTVTDELTTVHGKDNGASQSLYSLMLLT